MMTRAAKINRKHLHKWRCFPHCFSHCNVRWEASKKVGSGATSKVSLDGATTSARRLLQHLTNSSISVRIRKILTRIGVPALKNQQKLAVGWWVFDVFCSQTYADDLHFSEVSTSESPKSVLLHVWETFHRFRSWIVKWGCLSKKNNLWRIPLGLGSHLLIKNTPALFANFGHHEAKPSHDLWIHPNTVVACHFWS